VAEPEGVLVAVPVVPAPLPAVLGAPLEVPAAAVADPALESHTALGTDEPTLAELDCVGSPASPVAPTVLPLEVEVSGPVAPVLVVVQLPATGTVTVAVLVDTIG
jgi:hypothetical protein